MVLKTRARSSTHDPHSLALQLSGDLLLKRWTMGKRQIVKEKWNNINIVDACTFWPFYGSEALNDRECDESWSCFTRELNDTASGDTLLVVNI